MNLSDKETEKIASDFLEKNDLLPNNFVVRGVGNHTITNAKDESDTKVLRKEVYYTKTLDNKNVFGNSKIIVGVEPSGNVDMVYSVTRETSDKKSIKIKSFEEAWNDLEEQKGMITMSNNEADKVKIKKIELAYWEDSSPFNYDLHVQPVYVFNGEAIENNGKISKFEAIVPAIPDELIKTKEQTQVNTSNKPTGSEVNKEKGNIPLKK